MSGIADEIRIKDMIESLEYKRNYSQIARDALEVIEHLTKELADAKENVSAFESLWTEAKSQLAEKDKVLEEIATKTHGSALKARSILSKYARESANPSN